MSRSRTDQPLVGILTIAAIVAAAILLLILMFLLRESWPVLQKISLVRFFTDDGWYPLERRFGLAPMLLATLAAGIGAVLLAAPLGIAAALFTRFYAPRLLALPFQRMVTLLAGIPSVVFGFWGLTVLVPLIAAFELPGASLLAAILILTLMILPTIALTSDAALATVPEHYLHASAALGLSRATTIIGVVLPAAKAGIMSGILLAAARALGETMAVLMVAGNVVQIPTSLFDPIRTLTANIALEMAYATGDHRASLFVSGLMLMGLVLVLAMSASRLGRARLHG